MNKQPIRRALYINAAIAICAIAYALAFTLAKRMGSSIFDCRWVMRLGINCPGCGGSRALLCLLRLDFLQAFFYSPALVYCLLLLLWYDLTVILAAVRRDEHLLRLCPRVLLLIVPFIFLGVFGIRLFCTLALGMPPI